MTQFTSFDPLCTLPPNGTTHGFVNAPNVRSTMSIVWSCLSIIFLSTWSVLHPNVPPDVRPSKRRRFLSTVVPSTWSVLRSPVLPAVRPPNVGPGENPSKGQKLLRALYLAGRKMFWMVVMFFVPEAVTSICAWTIESGKRNSRILEKMAEKDGIPWSLTHTMLADMGGFAICFEDKDLIHQIPNRKNGQNSLPKELGFIENFEMRQRRLLGPLGTIPWKPHPGHFSNAEEVKNSLVDTPMDWKLENLAALSGTIWILDSKQLILARKHGVIETLPKVDEAQIMDKSKSNSLVKAIALCQVVWLVVQLIARKIGGLASTPLEISTVATAVSAFVLYIIEWDKPKDIGIPIYVNASTSPIAYNAFYEIFKAAPYPYLQLPHIQTKNYYIPSCGYHDLYGEEKSSPCSQDLRLEKFLSPILRFLNSLNSKPEEEEKQKGPDEREQKEREQMERAKVSAVVGPITGMSIILFSSIHMLAWNFQFPTDIEKLLWRICALLGIVLPVVYSITHIPFFIRGGFDISQRASWIMRISQGIIGFVYFFARLFIIAETFRSLYYLPPHAFTATWSGNLPHIS